MWLTLALILLLLSIIVPVAPRSATGGTIACGGRSASYYVSRTGEVCAGGKYGSWQQSRTGEVAGGGEYDSWQENHTGKVCAGGKYDSWHESSTGEVACGGRYDGYHISRTGSACAGGLYSGFVDSAVTASGGRKESNADSFCRILQDYKGKVAAAVLLDVCRKSRSQEDCRKCLE